MQRSIQFSSVIHLSDSLRPHELQHTRLPCPSPTPRVHPNPCPLSWWCHTTISSCCPLLLPPSIFHSIRVFSNESALRIRWPKYWSFSFNILWNLFLHLAQWFSSVQLLSRVWLFATPWTAAHQASLSITNSRSLLKLMCIESVMPSNHLLHPLSSPSSPTFSHSQHQGLFQWVSSSHQVAKLLEF